MISKGTCFALGPRNNAQETEDTSQGMLQEHCRIKSCIYEDLEAKIKFCTIRCEWNIIRCTSEWPAELSYLKAQSSAPVL